jgi:hypothetical protein
MIKRNLFCYPTSTIEPYLIAVEVSHLINGDLNLRYHVFGDLTQLRIPSPQPPNAAERLWEHTCFEVFIAVEGETKYYEFNFSPSSQWAAYAFSDYREQCCWAVEKSPCITFKFDTKQLLLEAIIHAVDLPENIGGKPLQLNLTAVIETQDGHRCYWALRHRAASPDFHDRESFILTLQQQ